MKYQFEDWQGIVFLSRAGEVLFSLGWQSPRDGVSIKTLVPITLMGWCQEGHPAYKNTASTYHEMTQPKISCVTASAETW